MSQVKLAAMLMMPLAFLCSVASAQQQASDNVAKSTAPTDIKSKSQSPQDEVYGFYVPYVPPAKNVTLPQGDAANTVPAACTTLQADPVYGTYVPYKGPAIACYTPVAQPAISNPQPANSTPVPPRQDVASSSPAPDLGPRLKPAPRPAAAIGSSTSSCDTAIHLEPDPVYGSYVPYTGPPVRLTACYTPGAQVASSNSAPPNSSPVQPHTSSQPDGSISQPISLPGGIAHPPDDMILAANSPAPGSGTSSSLGAPGGSTSGFIRPVPPPIEIKKPREIRPFRSVAIGFKGNTLGAGFELATPVSRSFNLRTSINGFAFNNSFSIDGVNYDARLHFKSSGTTLDWFPGRHGFHISPGILYVKNTLSAPAFVRPGQNFVLGTQTFTNSVDDPVNGSASVIYPNKYAPMLMLGFGNIIPRSGRHLSVPFEFGVAYTGAPQISVALDGTACTTQGCVSFAGNAEAQDYLKQEVHILNEDLKKYPVFPIVSLGLAYHF
jgi:hypothetical protein